MFSQKYYGEGGGGIWLLKLIGKLQRSFALLAAAAREADGSDFEDEEIEVSAPPSVPDDVKEGHLAVLAISGSEKIRFVVKIECLSNPAFLRLLQLAEEEFGFYQTGAISLPCPPEELLKIL